MGKFFGTVVLEILNNVLKVNESSQPKVEARAIGKANIAEKLEQLKGEVKIERVFAIVISTDDKERQEFVSRLVGCGFVGVIGIGNNADKDINDAKQQLGAGDTDFILMIDLIEKRLKNSLNKVELDFVSSDIDINLYAVITQYLKDV